VELRVVTSPNWLTASVVDATELGMVVRAPGGTDLVVHSGDAVTVRWLEQGAGLGLLDTAVAGTVRESDGLAWLLRASSAPTIVQRRRHLRVPVTVPAAAAWGADEQRLLTLDLAEGGVRCVAGGALPVKLGEAVTLTVDLDGRPVRSPAQVVRRTESPGGTTVAFKFVGLPRPDADRLRRFVLAREVELAGRHSDGSGRHSLLVG
jgi:c-di-GMP-binding flagellar brake protein YcgR